MACPVVQLLSIHIFGTPPEVVDSLNLVQPLLEEACVDNHTREMANALYSKAWARYGDMQEVLATQGPSISSALTLPSLKA